LKSRCAIVLSLLMLPLAVESQAVPDAQVLVESEHAFARDAARVGVRDAFLHWLAPTGVVFAPGPVNGLRANAARHATPARLAWEPEVAVISSSGDLGWTTGPWTWRHDSTLTVAEAWGEYLTLWRRQPGGDWKAALDIGIDHDAPAGAAPALVAHALPPARGAGRSPLSRRHSLWQCDADFAKTAAAAGVPGAYDRFGAEDLRLLLPGTHRIDGRAAARDSMRARAAHPAMMSLAQFISESGDLGYTYGSFVEKGAAGMDSSYYVHIWQRGATRPWELAVELLQPVPKRAK